MREIFLENVTAIIIAMRTGFDTSFACALADRATGTEYKVTSIGFTSLTVKCVNGDWKLGCTPLLDGFLPQCIIIIEIGKSCWTI